MSVVTFPARPALQVDANGFPIGHQAGILAAAIEMVHYVNELPNGAYHMDRYEAETAADRCVTRYLTTVEAIQKAPRT